LRHAAGVLDSPQDLLETLESLLADPGNGVASVYRKLQDFQVIMLHRIAQRAYQLGLEKAARATEGIETAMRVENKGNRECARGGGA